MVNVIAFSKTLCFLLLLTEDTNANNFNSHQNPIVCDGSFLAVACACDIWPSVLSAQAQS